MDDDLYERLFSEGSLNNKGAKLVEVDYNLNSPLMPTVLDYSLESNFRQIPIQFRSKVKDAHYLIKISQLPFNSIKTTSYFHNVIGIFNLYDFKATKISENLLNFMQTQGDITSWVPITYIKGLYHKDVPRYVLKDTELVTRKYLEYFYFTNYLTILMNSEPDDLPNIHKSYPLIKVRVLETEDNYPVYKIKLPSPFHVILIYKSFIIFKNYNLLLDRDCLLMLKDIYLARFQSLFSYQFRSDETYTMITLKLMVKLYAIGDKLLEKYGTKVYTVFQLLEPMCNLQLCELSRVYRDKIPRLDTFSNHVISSINELNVNFPGCIEIYDIISSIRNHNDVLAVFSSFRHWGHPFINYKEGVKELFERLNKERNIDKNYSNILASNLARKVISNYFRKYKKWPIDMSKFNTIPIVFQSFIKDGTWPSTVAIQRFKHKWHLLPIIPIFEIPETLSPQIILSDKSHTVNRSDFINYINSNKPTSRRVLDTFRLKEQRNFKDFLTNISSNGLDDDALIIALCAKEKELKEKGRYFALMSWDMRDYFVSTEYLIKEHFLPYFHGITMADDQSKLVKKMLRNTMGQGRDDYEQITIANHIDYEKWCNSQTFDSTESVFKFMGCCYGLPNLFSYTHKIFENSWIFHKHRTDLIDTKTTIPSDKDPSTPTFMNGIKGGLEGLRQKGWSIISLLIIEHEMLKGPADVKVLAQGDNQVICVNFKTNPQLLPTELSWELQKIVKVNQTIISNIEKGIEKMGLSLNKDETMQSADYLVYGKIPVFRGQIFGLEPKRWSRVNTVSNDQIPTLGNLLSSASSNALVVSMYASSPISCIMHYNYISHFVLFFISKYNIILKKDMLKHLKKNDNDLRCKLLTYLIYLDPCLGGVGGTSLTRFIMRGFPDPVSESLSFWKFLYKHTLIPSHKRICIEAGYPKLSTPTSTNINKLIEDPQSLNLFKGFDGTSYVKRQIRQALYNNRYNFRNVTMRTAVENYIQYDSQFVQFLYDIKPLFPRFISNFYSASWFGIIESYIRLFERSKTLIIIFGRELNADILDKIKETESTLYHELTHRDRSSANLEMWKCTRIQADSLRLKSWGKELVATTIPHPIELLDQPIRLADNICEGCEDDLKDPIITRNFISVLIPNGIINYTHTRGALKAYLGSKTPEDTSIIRPYEKAHSLPVITRSLNLLKIINWITGPDSNLTKSILANIQSQANLNIDIKQKGIKVSGNYAHRFFSDRQSAGGYCNQSVNKLTRMSVSSDNFRHFDFEDGNFMFQSLMLYSQHVIGEIQDNNPNPMLYHFHINCTDCIQSIPMIQLESPYVFNFPVVSHILVQWQPSLKDLKNTVTIEYKNKVSYWDQLNYKDKSFFVGFNQGCIFSILALEGSDKIDNNSLFPITLINKLDPYPWYEGLLMGLLQQSCLEVCTLNITRNDKELLSKINGLVNQLIDLLLKNNNYLLLTSTESMMNICGLIPHKIPPSYPLTNTDSAALQISILRFLLGANRHNYFSDLRKTLYYIAPDFSESYQQQLINIGIECFNTFAQHNFNYGLISNKIKRFASLYSRSRSNELTEQEIKQVLAISPVLDKQIRVIAREEIAPFIITEIDQSLNDLIEPKGTIINHKLTYCIQEDYMYEIKYKLKCPLISGIRWAQLSTGSYWKISSIISSFEIIYQDFICGGDGSGGITGLLARSNQLSKYIFNTLLVFNNSNLSGTEPRPPSVLTNLGSGVVSRCVNYNDVWKNPSNLFIKSTWEYFLKTKTDNNMIIDLIILDMELTEQSKIQDIVHLIREYSHQIMEKKSTLILKTYYSYLFEFKILNPLIETFKTINIVSTLFTSNFSEEIYIICRDLKLVRKHILYPDLVQLRNSVDFILPCNSNMRDEWERCQQAYFYSKNVFYPEWLLPDPIIELEQVLRSIQVAPSLTMLLSDMIMLATKDNFLDIVFTILITGSYSIINSLKVTDHETYPSLTRWTNVAILFTTAHLLLTLSDSNEKLFEYMTMVYNNRFTFWVNRYHFIIKNNQDMGYKCIWSLREKKRSDRISLLIHNEGYTITKLLNQFIRLSHVLNINLKETRLDLQSVGKRMGNIHVNLNLPNLKNSSGWLDLIYQTEAFPIIYRTSNGLVLEEWKEVEDICIQTDDAP